MAPSGARGDLKREGTSSIFRGAEDAGVRAAAVPDQATEAAGACCSARSMTSR
jgi:hypothetical protein